jgi:hypothetical protein
LNPERAVQVGPKHGSRAVLQLHPDVVTMERPKTDGDVLDVLAI